MSVLVLTEAELRACVTSGEETLARVRDAFTWLAEGRVEMPPIMHIALDDRHGDVDIKSAYARGVDVLAVKVASGFFDNPARGLPSSSAMVVVLDANTGFCRAVLLDNGYLTDLRTGLAGAVAAQVLAPRSVATVGVVGAGAQARYQVESLALVRTFRRVLVKARSAERERACVADLARHFAGRVEVAVAPDLETLVRESQVVVTTTPAREPLIRAEWLHAGMHLTAMGSDLAGKQELDPACLARADLLVCDRRAQCLAMGELQHADARVKDDPQAVVELGEITAGRHRGRTSEGQITVCDLTGTGVQDTAIAAAALARAAATGAGTVVG